MRRTLGTAWVLVLGLGVRTLGAQSTCRGDHCSVSLSATLMATVPAIARVSVVSSARGAAIVIWGNARLVLQVQRDSASSAPATLGKPAVTITDGRFDLRGEGSVTVRYTATAP